MTKKPTDLTTSDSADIDDEGGSGEIDVNETTYSRFAKEHGLDFSEMTEDEIREIIHQYSQEGKVKKGAKVYDMQGNLISHRAKQSSTKTSGRTYQVTEDNSQPMTKAEFEKAKSEKEYIESSEKKDEPTPGKPFNPTPRRPG